MFNGMHITIPRTKLIDIITEQKSVLQTEYDNKIEEVKTELDGMSSVPEALKEWHGDIAEGLANGAYAVKADGTIVAGAGNTAEEPPEKPSVSRKNTSKKALRNEIQNLESAAQIAAAAFDSALLLLNHATDTDINVPVSDYERLLNQRVGRYSY